MKLADISAVTTTKAPKTAVEANPKRFPRTGTSSAKIGRKKAYQRVRWSEEETEIGAEI